VEVGDDQLQPGVEDGGTPTEVVAEESKKILKRRNKENPTTKKQMVGEQWGRGIPSPHLIHGILWW
jgi:hypothetical protein